VQKSDQNLLTAPSVPTLHPQDAAAVAAVLQVSVAALEVSMLPAQGVFAALVSVFAALVSVCIADARFLDAASAAVAVVAVRLTARACALAPAAWRYSLRYRRACL